MNLTAFSIDLGAPFFWLFLAVAVLVLVPLTAPEPRRVALAVLNIGFIAFVAGPWGALGAVVFALVLRMVVGANANNTVPHAVHRSGVALVGVGVLVLFLVHKLAPAPLIAEPPTQLRQLLAAIGFSYVALRCVELLRAGVENHVRSAGWLEVISYLFPFHMLAAGPIQSWGDFVTQGTTPPRLGWLGVLDAVERIVQGLFKKFVLARAIEVAFLTSFRAPWPYLLFEIQVYCLWVYLDFSAYSDIAVGAGRLMGVATPENFNNPFGARNIIEFWSRWHISLSSFIRRNIFIPLQLVLMRRVGVSNASPVTALALVVAFVLVGLWHGVALRFVIWGAFHAGAIILCSVYGRALSARLGRKSFAAYLAKPGYRLVASGLTFEFVAFSLAFIAHPATTFLR